MEEVKVQAFRSDVLRSHKFSGGTPKQKLDFVCLVFGFVCFVF